MLTLGSLFSGLGAFDLAWQRCGGKVAWQCEIDATCCRVLERHWPGVKRYGDIRDVRGADLGTVDVIAGGFPCQDLSIAGRRAGLAGARSGLFFELARLVRELQPAWLLLENVPGLLSDHGGRGFAVVLHELGECGYGLAWRVLDAQHWGVPQRRRRVFIVGRFGGPVPAEILAEPESSQGHPSSRQTSGPGTAAGSEDGAGEPSIANALTSHHGRNDPSEEVLIYQCHGGNVGEMGTLRSGNGHVTGGVPFTFQPQSGGQVRLGFTDDGCRSLQASQIPAVAHTLRSEGADASEDGTGRGVPLVVTPFDERVITGGAQAGLVVRRLTPLLLECERLMGLPDGWTALDAAGRPISDSARYRMLGNAVVVTVAEWIFGRLMRATSEVRG